jgi:uncharacterized protein (TIGR02444 family)
MATAAPHPFWQFSLRIYAKPGVEQACLRLQDREGVDVNLLLLCCWAAASGRGALTKRTLRAAMSSVANWQTEVIAPLRAARRRLKQGFDRVPQERTAELRKRIGKMEIECEHSEQLLLARHVEALPRAGRSDDSRAALTGIERYFACIDARPSRDAREDITTIIAASLAP